MSAAPAIARVILSYGLGVDSTAILLRWLLESETRDFPLGDLVVLTAQTGDEWPQTKHLVETCVYPLLAEHRVRTVQIARAGASLGEGYAVLDDTRTPSVCHTGGAHTLSAELLGVGTVPQAGGIRKCSLKFKGDPLDRWIADHTRGEPYRHVVGFEAGEVGRMLRDAQVSKRALPGRIPQYPLIEWGWDRAACERYLREKLGVQWRKSACLYCPFALTSEDGRARMLPRYIADPEQAMLPLLMEHVAVAINPKQGLIAGRRLRDALATHPASAELLARFAEHLNAHRWAIYEVRRAFRAHPKDVMRPANSVRSLRRLAEGTREEVLTELATRAAAHGTEVEAEGGHYRAWLARRGMYFPCREHALVAAPAVVADKTNGKFEEVWEAAAGTMVQPSLFEAAS